MIQQVSGISAHSRSRVASTADYSTSPRPSRLCEGVPPTFCAVPQVVTDSEHA